MSFSREELDIIVSDSSNFNQIAIKLGYKNPNTTTYNKILSQIIENNIDYSHISRNSKYDRDTLREAAESSHSLYDMCSKLKISVQCCGTILFEIRRWKIDISHFDGRSHLTYTNCGLSNKHIPLDIVFLNKVRIKNDHLKQRLFSENIKKYKCEKCNREHYFGFPIPLELNHINGDDNDNTLSNLEILCPNCHSRTPTFAGRNKKDARLWRISENDFREKVTQASSYTSLLYLIYEKANGGSSAYSHAKKLIEQYNCDITHWKIGTNKKKGTTSFRFSDLKINTNFKSHELRLRLFASGLKNEKCEICGITDWDGQKLSFTLDHINGIKTDNRLENLRILCFICHARTPTYKGKNISKEKLGKSIPYQRSKDGLPSSHFDKR